MMVAIKSCLSLVMLLGTMVTVTAGPGLMKMQDIGDDGYHDNHEDSWKTDEEEIDDLKELLHDLSPAQLKKLEKLIHASYTNEDVEDPSSGPVEEDPSDTREEVEDLLSEDKDED